MIYIISRQEKLPPRLILHHFSGYSPTLRSLRGFLYDEYAFILLLLFLRLCIVVFVEEFWRMTQFERLSFLIFILSFIFVCTIVRCVHKVVCCLGCLLNHPTTMVLV